MGKKVYVIGNSHMDPIWIWRLREGRAAWLNTCRAVVNMMKKHPFLKFSRSSSVCYRWIEETDPGLFREIRRLVDAGRWELVGGWVEQADVIITPGESLLRQGEHGKAYFQEKFGRDVRTAYCVDSFGQNVGLPKLLKASGFDNYVWMRPQQHEKALPYQFRWRCDDGRGDVVCCRVRGEYATPPSLSRPGQEWTMEKWFARATAGDEANQVFFFGIGDHGGGIYENQLKELLKIGEKQEIVFATLGEFFAALRREDLPLVDGELTHHAPGCYAAEGQAKGWVADAEKNLYKAEKIVLQCHHQDQKESVVKLRRAWEELLFDYFHDIYSGTSIRPAYQHEVRDSLGAVNLAATNVLETALCRVGAAIKSDFLTEGGVLFWNPLPHATVGNAFYSAFSDPNCTGAPFNCLRDAAGEELPLQWVRNLTSFGISGAVFSATMPASGFRAFAYARTQRQFPALGFARQKALLRRLRFEIVEDKNDTWAHGATALGKTLGAAQMLRQEAIDDGPVCSRLRCHYRWKRSNFQLDLIAWRGIAEIEAVFASDWRDLGQTLKLTLATRAKEALSGQAAASVARPAGPCEQPFIDYVAASGDGFYAHALHSYDFPDARRLRLTVLRPVIYAQHQPAPPNGEEGAADVGPQERRFWIVTGGGKTPEALLRAARQRLWGCEHFEITAAGNGKRARWDVWETAPDTVAVLAERLTPGGKREFRLYNPGAQAVKATIRRNGKAAATCALPPRAIATVRL